MGRSDYAIVTGPTAGIAHPPSASADFMVETTQFTVSVAAHTLLLSAGAFHARPPVAQVGLVATLPAPRPAVTASMEPAVRMNPGRTSTTASFVLAALVLMSVPAWPQTAGDADNDGLPDAWETRFGVDPTKNSGDNGGSGDPDRDGLTNANELALGSHPRGLATRTFAEGATGAFFDARFALFNPDTKGSQGAGALSHVRWPHRPVRCRPPRRWPGHARSRDASRSRERRVLDRGRIRRRHRRRPDDELGRDPLRQPRRDRHARGRRRRGSWPRARPTRASICSISCRTRTRRRRSSRSRTCCRRARRSSRATRSAAGSRFNIWVNHEDPAAGGDRRLRRRS